MTNGKEVKSKIITVIGDSLNKELGTAIEKSIASFLKSNSEYEFELEKFVINTADFSVGGYGKALVTINYTVGKKK